MTTLRTILAVLMILAILAGCSVEHRADCTIYRFGIDPSPAVCEARGGDANYELPVVGPASKPALPGVDANEYQ